MTDRLQEMTGRLSYCATAAGTSAMVTEPTDLHQVGRQAEWRADCATATGRLQEMSDRLSYCATAAGRMAGWQVGRQAEWRADWQFPGNGSTGKLLAGWLADYATATDRHNSEPQSGERLRIDKRLRIEQNLK